MAQTNRRASRQPARYTRRGFLAGSAAAIAAPYIVPSSVFGANAPSNRITMGCIGIRNRGMGVMRSFLGLSDVQVVAVCDVDSQNLDKAKRTAESKGGIGVDAYLDYRDIMARDDIDTVMIATPDHTHAVISTAAIRAGKDVFCEKPMTLTIHEGRVISDLARQYGRVFQTGNQRRSSEKQRRACELIINGRIGKVERIDVGVGHRPKDSPALASEPVPEHFDFDRWLGPAPAVPYQSGRCHYNFRFVRDYSGGEMTNFGAHYLDLGQWALGMDNSGPVEIDGKGDYFATGLYDTFHTVDITYTYANGTVMTCTDRYKGCRAHGTEGWLDIEQLEASDPAILKSTIGPGEIHFRQSHGNHNSDFIHAVKHRHEPTSPAETGHRTATVCHLGNLAMTLGRKLHWDPKTETFKNDEEANRLRHRPYREPWVL